MWELDLGFCYADTMHSCVAAAGLCGVCAQHTENSRDLFVDVHSVIRSHLHKQDKRLRPLQLWPCRTEEQFHFGKCFEKGKKNNREGLFLLIQCSVCNDKNGLLLNDLKLKLCSPCSRIEKLFQFRHFLFKSYVLEHRFLYEGQQTRW